MNASQRPQRRRKSSLADEHPAYPDPAPETQPEPDADVTANEIGSADAVEPETDSEQPTTEVSRVAARPRDPEAGRPGSHAEQRARAEARNGGWAWAKAHTRLDRRLVQWREQMATARAEGTAPAVLREYIQEAADRIGIESHQVPDEIWRAAGLAAEAE